MGAIFLVNVPFVLGGLLFGYLLVPESKDPTARRLDLGGALLSIVGIGAVLWSVIEAPSKGWQDPGVVISFIEGALLLTAFVLWERRSPYPDARLHVVEGPSVLSGGGAIAVTFMTLVGMIFLMTQYL